MIKQKWVLIAAIYFLMISCNSPILFEHPYPVKDEKLSTFPESFLGYYICESDSSILIIDKEIILHETRIVFETSYKNIMDSHCKITDDVLYIPGYDECIPYTFTNDSVISANYIQTDTLFRINENQILKEWNNNLILSQKQFKSQWVISVLTPTQDGNILYRAITEESDIDALSKITAMSKIPENLISVDRYLIKPSKREFDEILNNHKIFIECESLTRVNLENPPNCIYEIKSGNKEQNINY